VLFFLLGAMVALPLLGAGVGIWHSAIGSSPAPPEARIGIALAWAGGVLAGCLILVGSADLLRHLLRLQLARQAAMTAGNGQGLPGGSRDSSGGTASPKRGEEDFEAGDPPPGTTIPLASSPSRFAGGQAGTRLPSRDDFGTRPPGIQPGKAFVSYSHKDESFRQALDISLAQLKRSALISVWDDRKILPGQEWGEEIDRSLEDADLILVLVSFDFLNSEYAYGREMQRAIERHKSGAARVVPIIVRASDWQHGPLGTLQVLPSNGKPVSEWPDPDQAWLDVVRGLRKLLKIQGPHSPGRSDRPLRRGSRPSP
jgi:hypothetical protein